MVFSLGKVFRLATRDYFHEWQMSGCFVLALAAVLGPMLVLFGLKFGIVGAMVDQLIEDPHNREIHPARQRSFRPCLAGRRAQATAGGLPGAAHPQHRRKHRTP